MDNGSEQAALVCCWPHTWMLYNSEKYSFSYNVRIDSRIDRKNDLVTEHGIVVDRAHAGNQNPVQSDIQQVVCASVPHL